MGLNFNSVLLDAGIEPSEVRLLRHQTALPNGLTPFDLWQRDRAAFDDYQSYQQHAQRAHFSSPYWASFLGLRDGRTMFSGLYTAGPPETVDRPYVQAATGLQFDEGLDDRYPLQLADELSSCIGLLYIDWGDNPSSKRAWRQRADLQVKPITELHLEGASVPFPGFNAFIEPLSQILALPQTWVQTLAASKGIYLLTCPRTGEHYVGSAIGVDGFWGRWSEYVANGHGGNVALKQRDPSDYQVSILEVAGSRVSDAEILALEQLWKMKLRSRASGLNGN